MCQTILTALQGAPVSRRVPLKEEQFPMFLVKVLYYTQALLLFNAIDTGDELLLPPLLLQLKLSLQTQTVVWTLKSSRRLYRF